MAMSALALKFTIMFGVVMLATAAGYSCRRLRWRGEGTGERIMTFVAVIGYPAVGFLSVWGTALHRSDVVLPVMAAAHAVLMLVVSAGMAGLFTRDRQERGLFALAGGVGNNGFTMGAFVLYLLYGEPGMGLANIYILLFMPVVVLVMYPLARRYASEQAGESLLSLLRRSVFDWRSVGLPATAIAIALSAFGVPRPAQVSRWHVVDALVYGVTPLAFFGIGLRLHFSRVLPLWRLLLGLALVRFGVCAGVGVALAALTWLTPWPIRDLRWNVYVIQAFVPTSVTMVAVANMFGLHPREASVLFVVNTGMYLVLVLPVILWWVR
jgi:predicted permease